MDGDESDASKQARELILDPVSEAASTVVDYAGRKVSDAKNKLTAWVQGPWWMWFAIGLWIGSKRRK